MSRDTVNFFPDKQKFTGIQQEFYRNSTGIQIEFLKIGRKIRLCYRRHLIFTGNQNYRNSVYRNSPEFTGIHRNSPEFTGIHRNSRIPVCPIKFTVVTRKCKQPSHCSTIECNREYVSHTYCTHHRSFKYMPDSKANGRGKSQGNFRYLVLSYLVLSYLRLEGISDFAENRPVNHQNSLK